MTLADTLVRAFGFSDEAVIEGRVTPDMRTAHEQKVRRARLEYARRHPLWTEVEEPDIVRRGRLLVRASTDELFRLHSGAAFQPHSDWPIADKTELFFYVTRDDELVFLERERGTYTERLEAQAERERRRNAPKPTPKWAQR